MNINEKIFLTEKDIMYVYNQVFDMFARHNLFLVNIKNEKKVDFTKFKWEIIKVDESEVDKSRKFFKNSICYKKGDLFEKIEDSSDMPKILWGLNLVDIVENLKDEIDEKERNDKIDYRAKDFCLSIIKYIENYLRNKNNYANYVGKIFLLDNAKENRYLTVIGEELKKRDEISEKIKNTEIEIKELESFFDNKILTIMSWLKNKDEFNLKKDLLKKLKNEIFYLSGIKLEIDKKENDFIYTLSNGWMGDGSFSLSNIEKFNLRTSLSPVSCIHNFYREHLKSILSYVKVKGVLQYDDFGASEEKECKEVIYRALDLCANKYFLNKGEYEISKELLFEKSHIVKRLFKEVFIEYTKINNVIFDKEQLIKEIRYLGYKSGEWDNFKHLTSKFSIEKGNLLDYKINKNENVLKIHSRNYLVKKELYNNEYFEDFIYFVLYHNIKKLTGNIVKDIKISYDQNDGIDLEIKVSNGEMLEKFKNLIDKTKSHIPNVKSMDRKLNNIAYSENFHAIKSLKQDEIDSFLTNSKILSEIKEFYFIGEKIKPFREECLFNELEKKDVINIKKKI